MLGSAHAQDDSDDDSPTQTEGEEESDNQEENPLSPYRTRFDDLAERTIGTASKSVAFNWRRTDVQIAASSSFLFELNNFNSWRGGARVRVPTEGSILEFGANYVRVWDSPSSELLALTPYRQPGRPDRVELDFTFGYPLAEGVVTTAPKFFPAVQLVFNAYAEFRYLVHPTGWPNLRPGEVVTALLSPRLSQDEIDNLDRARLDAMQVDPGRYGILLGFGNDLYFEQGVFISPRLMVAVPLLAPATETDLLVWADFTLAVGMAF